MKNLIQTTKQTWKTYWQNKKEIPIAAVSDLLFYYFLALLAGYVIKQMVMFAEQTASTLSDLNTATMPGSPAIMQYKDINMIMGMFLAGIPLIWIAFKGISWWQAHKTLGERISPKEFIKKFALTTIFFYAMTIILAFLATYAQYRIYFTAGTGAIAIITLILLLAILYFGTIAYSTIERSNPIKNSFALGIKKWKHILLPFTTSIIAFAAAAFLFYFLAIQNLYAALGAALLIILPAVHYFRLLMINTLKKAGA